MKNRNGLGVHIPGLLTLCQSRIPIAMTDAPNNRVPKSAAKPGGVTPPPARARAQPNEAFDQEVDEELKKEQLAELWEKYSGYILAGAVAIVLGVGGYKFMESRRIAASEAAGTQYVAAVKQLVEGKAEPATASLTAIGNSSSGFAVLAQFRLAAADVAAGKKPDAVAKYDAITRMSGADPMMADFARLQSAMLQLDTLGLADIKARVAGLLADTNPWRFEAREVVGFAAMKAKDRAEARTQFEKLISETGVPPGMAERARIVMGSIAAQELAEKMPAPPVGAPVTTPASAPAVAPATPAPVAPSGGGAAKKK
jgi:hypothetical protein